MIILNNDEQKINFYKNRILKKLELIKDDMSPEKYKYFTSMVLDCDRYEELREMSEMDMQIEFINYTRTEIIDKLAEQGLTLEDAKRLQEERNNAADLQLITPARKKANPDIFALDNSEVGEALDNEEMLDAAAAILYARLQNEPPEEKYSDIIDNIQRAGNISDTLDKELDDLLDTEDDIDDYDPLDELDDYEEDNDDDSEETNESEYNDPLDELYSEEDDYYSDEDYDPLDEIDEYDMDDGEWEDDEYYNDDNALDSIPEADKKELESIKNKFIIDDDEDDDLEFGYEEAKEIKENQENSYRDPLDDLDVDIEDEDDYDPLDDLEDDIDEDDQYDPLDDLDESEEDEYDPLDDLDDGDYDPLDDFEENEEDDEDSEYDPLDDIEDDIDDDLEDENENSNDYDPLDALDDEDDGFLDIDNIDADDLFTPDLTDPLDELDDWEDSEYEEKSDKETSSDLDKFINQQNKAKNTEVKRIIKQDKVFLNGTKRGEETQKMYNLVNNILNRSSKTINKAGRQLVNKSKVGMSRLSRSEFLN